MLVPLYWPGTLFAANAAQGMNPQTGWGATLSREAQEHESFPSKKDIHKADQTRAS